MEIRREGGNGKRRVFKGVRASGFERSGQSDTLPKQARYQLRYTRIFIRLENKTII